MNVIYFKHHKCKQYKYIPTVHQANLVEIAIWASQGPGLRKEELTKCYLRTN